MERCTCNLHPFSSNDTKKAMKLHAFVADNAEGRLTMRERDYRRLNSHFDPVSRGFEIAMFATLLWESCYAWKRNRKEEKKASSCKMTSLNVSLFWNFHFHISFWKGWISSVRYNRSIGITLIVENFKEIAI